MAKSRKPQGDTPRLNPEKSAATSPPATAAPVEKPAADKKPGAEKGTKPGEEKAKPKHQDGMRETIESVVVAFILAFLFRTFEAEAFVIPTGSMAPTLLGRHKDVVCPQCGTQFPVGASYEVDKSGSYLINPRLSHAMCPNCRYITDIFDEPVFKGDRILVNKFPYEIGTPDRWDVLVFKYPEDPKTNYIKRLVGLPGETIEIRQGDIYVHRDGQVRLVRKDDANKQLALQIPVHDNDRPARRLLAEGWPERWAAVARDGGADGVAGWSETTSGWQLDADARAFDLPLETAKGSDLHWVRYRHILPTQRDWEAVTEDPPRAPGTPRPQLITDFCGYNAVDAGPHSIEDGLYWVGDLTVRFNVEISELTPEAQLVVELNEGVRKYRVRIDPNTGEATLYYPSDLSRDDGPDDDVVLATATTDLRGPGKFEIVFANVDDRLSLWIDGDFVDFGEKSIYQPYGGKLIQRPWEEDLIPAGIAARGAAARVSSLKLYRDIYYRGDYIRPEDGRLENPPAFAEFRGDPHDLRSLLHDPERWGEEYESNQLRDDETVPQSTWLFELSENEYFMLGDNSPASQDSRRWSNLRGDLHRHAVPESALVGKAFFIYWPHGVPFMNNGRGYPDDGDSIFNSGPWRRFFYHEFAPGEMARPPYPSNRVPFYPNIGRMERIR